MRRLGAGQFGEVWLVESANGMKKAMKVMLRPADDEGGKRELRSLDLIKNEQHPYLLRTEDYWIEDNKLYVLMDCGASEVAFASLAQSFISAGVHVIQLRDKQADDSTLLSRAKLLRSLLRNSASQLPLFIMNDRPDLALLAQADGVHVGQEELSVYEVRQIVGPKLLIGVSTHNLAQAQQAVLDGANYLGCGPIFPSETKSFDTFPGLDFLHQVAAEISLPAFAIGGINRVNLPSVLATGFTRIALSGALTAAEDPAAEVAKLLALL